MENAQAEAESFLFGKKKQYNSLGCGFHNGAYYFGFNGVRDGKDAPAVITSRKELFINRGLENNEIKTLFGLNCKNEFCVEGVEFPLTGEIVFRFLKEDTSDVSFSSVHKKLVDVLKKYICFYDARAYDLLACYRIAGFFMHVWLARARLFIHAEAGASKSRLTCILHNTGFNSALLGDWTLPFIKSFIEDTRGEVHIDDFESLDLEKKNSTERLVKVGYMKGFKSGKLGEGEKRKREAYDLFNTTTLNNTEGLGFIAADRCLTIRIPKIESKDYNREPDFLEPIWEELRSDLWILGLKYPEVVREAYQKITSDKFNGRNLSVFKPELTIAKLISEEVFRNIEGYWSEEIFQRKGMDSDNELYYDVCEQIYRLNFEEFFPLNDVVEPVGRKMYGLDYERRKQSLRIRVGNMLISRPIYESERRAKGKFYRVKNREDFVSHLKEKGFYEDISQEVDTRLSREAKPEASPRGPAEGGARFCEEVKL